MPALKAFGRRWAVASDDFVFPGLTELLFRSAWVAVVLTLIIVHATSGGFSSTCSLDTNLNIFYFWTLALYICFVLLSLVIATVSSRGTIMNERPRRALPYLLYIRAALILPEIALNIFGSMWLFYPIVDADQCGSFMKEAIPVAQTIVILSWLLLLGSIVLLFVIFDPLGREPISPANPRFQEISQSSNAQVWERRFKWCCFCFAGSQAEYNDIGNMLAEYFVDTDLVATDIAAGLALLAAKRQHNLDHPPHPPHFPIDSIPNWMNLGNALHYMPFGNAMYGWPFFVFRQVPFMVIADKQKKVIIVAIRGTLSLADAVTDITARAELFSPNEIPPYLVEREVSPAALWYAHKGILMAARWVVRRLIDDNVLQQAFDTHPSCNQGVVVVGHSLGAGTAALVTVLLKNRRDPVLENKEIRCFAYAPPGGLVSQDLNTCVAQDIICSVALSGDLVPRLSLPNMLRLKIDLIKALQSSCRAKYRVFGGVLCSKACCVKAAASTENLITEAEEGYAPLPSNDYQSLIPSPASSLGVPVDEVPPSPVPSTCPAVIPASSIPRSITAEPKLYPPGRVLTINENKDATTSTRYTATFCDPTKCFGNIIIGTDMIRHHFPYTLHDALLARPRDVTTPSTTLS